MFNDEILETRKQLEESIRLGQDYDIVYKLSLKLDDLITKYYTAQIG